MDFGYFCERDPPDMDSTSSCPYTAQLRMGSHKATPQLATKRLQRWTSLYTTPSPPVRSYTSKMSYPQEIFMTFSFLAFLASVIPLPWHLEGCHQLTPFLCRKLIRHWVFCSMEHGYLSVHDLDGYRLPQPVHQLDHMAQQCN
jgi:hypothetical protein